MGVADWVAARSRQLLSWRERAETVTWTYAAGGTSAVPVVVDRQAVRRVDLEDGEWEEARAVLRLSTAAVTPVIGDTVTIAGAVWHCVEIVGTDNYAGIVRAAVRRRTAVKRHGRGLVAHEGE